MTQSAPILEVEGLARRFGRVRAVAGIDLSVARGEIVALLGPNGAGKTTTLACIAGLLEPHAGSIRVNGHEAAAERERRVAYVPEIPMVYEDLSAREHLAFVAAGRRIANASAAVRNAIERMGMNAFADRPAGDLAKGMRQRLSLAGALLAQSDVLLLDEPTTGLDPAAQHELTTIVRDLAARGTAIVMSTHALAIAFSAATRIAVIVAGRTCSDERRESYPDIDALRRAYVHVTTA